MWAPDPAELPANGSYIYLESDPGDFIGVGLTYLYTQANSVIELRESRPGEVVFIVEGFERWRGGFEPMANTALTAGFWPEVLNYPFEQPGISWSGEGRGCNSENGWLLIDQVAYEAGEISALDLRFEQHCGEDVPALRGAIHWRADDPTRPPGPVYPPPDDLWRADPGIVPASGNYVIRAWADEHVIYAEPDHTIGVGVYSNATIGSAIVTIAGPDIFIPLGNDFEGMVGFAKLSPGYYPDARRYPFHNPARGGFNWLTDGSDCDFEGWFAIDHVVYDGNVIDELDLRFERFCTNTSGNTPSHGQIHFVRE